MRTVERSPSPGRAATVGGGTVGSAYWVEAQYGLPIDPKRPMRRRAIRPSAARCILAAKGTTNPTKRQSSGTEGAVTPHALCSVSSWRSLFCKNIGFLTALMLLWLRMPLRIGKFILLRKLAGSHGLPPFCGTRCAPVFPPHRRFFSWGSGTRSYCLDMQKIACWRRKKLLRAGWVQSSFGSRDEK